MDNNLNIQIQNRLIEELTNSNNELKLINSISKIIQESTKINELVYSIIKILKTYSSYQHCAIYLMDDSEDILIQKGSSMPYTNYKKQSAITLNEDAIDEIARTGIPKIYSQFEFEGNNNYSRITIPMFSKEKKVVGVLDFLYPQVGYFRKNHLETLTTIGSIAATKIIELKDFEQIRKYQIQLEEFVHVVSHDLKSPLRSINALITWIKEDNKSTLNEVTLKNIELIDNVLIKMEDLIGSTLNYSKLDYDETKKEKVNLNEVLAELKKIIFIPKNFTVTVADNLPIFYGNKTKVSQIFQNLICNAIKYNDKPLGKLEIDFEEIQTHYQFSFKDNGIGINEKYFSKIFEIFQSLSVNKKSSGVGLSIVKKIVTYFEGEIWVESEEGIGSTFFFTLKK